MTIFFTGKELINIAIGIERNGAAFYDSLAASKSDSTVHTVYKYLAEQEREHIKRFQNMLNTSGDYQPPESYTSEYESYLKALIDSSVFTSEKNSRDLARNIHSDLEAIHIGIDAEKDSILFYSEILNVVRTSDQSLIHSIIEEEKSHIRQLVDLKRRLDKQ